MSDVTDWTELGIIPLQHHDPSFTVAGRRRLSAVRVHPRDGNNYTPGQQTYGDVQGGLLWLEQGGKREYLHSWWIGAAPAVAVTGGGGDDGSTRERVPGAPIDFGGQGLFGPLPGQGGSGGGGGGGGGSLWSPIRSSGAQPDDRYQLKAPAQPLWAAPTVFPKGWTSLVTSGTEEQKQHENLHPDFWGLVAVNAAGDPKAGTPVYDLSKDGTPDRYARLHSAWSVLVPPGVNGTGTIGALAWNIGPGGRLDNTGGPSHGLGHGLVVDYTWKEVGYAALALGGPWTLGGALGRCDKHYSRDDVDGNRITALHNWTGALFMMDTERDGSLAFEPVPYPDPYATDLPVKVHGHLCWRDATQQWQVHSSCAFFPDGPTTPPPPLPPPGTKPRRDPPPFFPPPPDPPDPPPSTQPPPSTPRTGYQTSDGRFIRVYDANGNLIEVRRVKGGILTQPGDETIPVTTNPETNPEGNPQPSGAASPPVVGGDNGVKPTYPTSANYLQLPGFIIKGTATAAGELDPTGAPIQSPEALAAFSGAPQIGYFAGIAAGDGTWSGFSNSTPASAYGYPKATGMVMLLPADVTVNQVASGTAETAAPAQISVPTGLSEISFGTPNVTTGRTGSGATCKGYAGGLLIGLTDGDGELQVGTPQIVLGEGGTAITGNVSVSGKLDVAGRLDPTTLELIDQVTDAIPAGAAGFRFDSATSARPLWKQEDETTEPIAYLSDVTGAGGGAWELVEAKTVTANSTTLTFSGLDGDADEAYLFVWSILNNSGTTAVYRMQPNGVSTGQDSRMCIWTTTFAVTNAADMRFGRALTDGECFGELVFYARKSIDSIARSRGMFSRGTEISTGDVSFVNMASATWSDTSTNVTSIEFEADQANGIGDGSRVALYKLVTA